MQKNGDTIDFVMCGLNYRMTDFQAALALGQLERFESELEKRKILAGRYFELLEGVDGVTLPQMVSGHSWQSFMVRLKSKNTRDRIINKLSERGVQSNIGAQALHCLTYFRDRYNLNNNMYPNSAELYETGLVLPLYGKLSIADIEYISSEFMVCLKKHEDHHETA